MISMNRPKMESRPYELLLQNSNISVLPFIHFCCWRQGPYKGDKMALARCPSTSPVSPLALAVPARGCLSPPLGGANSEEPDSQPRLRRRPHLQCVSKETPTTRGEDQPLPPQHSTSLASPRRRPRRWAGAASGEWGRIGGVTRATLYGNGEQGRSRTSPAIARSSERTGFFPAGAWPQPRCSTQSPLCPFPGATRGDAGPGPAPLLAGGTLPIL